MPVKTESELPPNPLTPEHQAFHTHLDICKRCRDNPFGLCPTGVHLIFAAARSIKQEIPICLNKR